MISKHGERMARARVTLTDPPPARTHAERMADARGVRLYGDNMRLRHADRRRIAAHRNEADRVSR
jgi:hypothetical protein